MTAGPRQENYDAAIAAPGWIMTAYVVNAAGAVILPAVEAALIMNRRRKNMQ